jgi:hypothetical protein
MHRCAAAVTIVVLLLTASTAFNPADGSPAQGSVADAAVRVVRFSASASVVSVHFARFAGGSRALSVPAGTPPAAGGYARLRPGTYAITVRSAQSGRVLLTGRMQPGAVYTVGVLIRAGTMRALLVHDDLTAPPSGSARVRLVQAAAGPPRAVVAFKSGPVLAGAAPFGTVTRYHTVRAGTWRVTAAGVTPAGTASPASEGRSTVAEVKVRAGRLITLVVGDAPSGALAVRAISDAAGARRDPTGPVPAGGGGMAAAPHAVTAGGSVDMTGAVDLVVVFALWAGLQFLVSRRRCRATGRGSAG